MKTLKKFIEDLNNTNEKNSSSLRIIDYIFTGGIPISPSSFERIFGHLYGRYLHATEVSNFKSLMNLQGTRKTISCFNKWENNKIFKYGATGIDLVYPCTFLLEGNYAIDAGADIYTSYDSAGRRWILPGEFPEQKGNIFKLIDKISKTIIQKYTKENPIVGELINSVVSGQKFRRVAIRDFEETSLPKSEVISKYIDISEKVILSFKSDIEKHFSKLTYNYNELLGYNFKVIGGVITKQSFNNYKEYRNVPSELNSLLTIAKHSEEQIKICSDFLQ